jgi:glutathione peroxidase-family protein
VKEIPWNFGKFVVDREGNVREFFPPDRKPNDMVPLLKQLLSS